MTTSIDLTMCFFFLEMLARVVMSGVVGSGLTVDRRSKCMALIEDTILNGVMRLSIMCRQCPRRDERCEAGVGW